MYDLCNPWCQIPKSEPQKNNNTKLMRSKTFSQIYFGVFQTYKTGNIPIVKLLLSALVRDASDVKQQRYVWFSTAGKERGIDPQPIRI